jgi:SAM-dependent methyltransferase
MITLDYRTNSWSTHQPVLYEYVRQTKGNILELGCGYGSTPLIMKLIEGTDRKLVSVDTNPEWLEKIKEVIPESHNHKYVLHANYKNDFNWENFLNSDPIFQEEYDLVFIDQQPWEGRVTSLHYFKNNSNYIIIHDTDYFATNSFFGRIIPNVPYEESFDFTDVLPKSKLLFPPKPWSYPPTGPPTLVGTTKDLPLFDIDWDFDKSF